MTALNKTHQQLKTVECACFLGQTSYGQLGLISDPQIYFKVPKWHQWSQIKGLEKKIYTMMKGSETFYGDHTAPITSCSVNIYFTYFLL